MNKINVWSIVAFTVVVSGLSIFTTLFFVKKSTIPQETVANAVVSQIPDKVQVKFAPAKPDCTYSDNIVWNMAKNHESLVVSKKTFKQALLSKDKKPLFNVTSEVLAYASVPVNYLENNITIDTNKDNLQKAIVSSLPKQQSKFFKGFMYGVGAGAVVVSAVCILSK